MYVFFSPLGFRVCYRYVELFANRTISIYHGLDFIIAGMGEVCNMD